MPAELYEGEMLPVNLKEKEQNSSDAEIFPLVCFHFESGVTFHPSVDSEFEMKKIIITKNDFNFFCSDSPSSSCFFLSIKMHRGLKLWR